MLGYNSKKRQCFWSEFAFLKVTLLPEGFYDFIRLLGYSVEVHIKQRG